jgi:hypothetical protein
VAGAGAVVAVALAFAGPSDSTDTSGGADQPAPVVAPQSVSSR